MADFAGFKIVLTADDTLMANYRLLFDGMLAASQTTTTPLPLMRALLLPRGKSDGLRAKVAPLGLRRIEAALLAGGFAPDDVAVVGAARLKQAIGPNTRIIGVSSGEPSELGMNSSTMTGIAGGSIYPAAMFRRLMKTVNAAAARAPQVKVVLGGPGAWQIAGDQRKRAALGVDYVVAGYADDNIAQVFAALAEGTAFSNPIVGECPAAEDVPAICGASTMGVVEISRGCGLGCSFCTIARQPMIHLPEETIAADAETNIAAGNVSIAALSEDFFRYGAHGFTANPPALLHMLERLRKIRELRLIQIDHANVASVARFDDAQLREVHDLLVGGNRHDYLWVNLGIETASGRLLRANGCSPKMAGKPEESWSSFCTEQIDRLCEVGFFPMVSLILGLPGETADDVQQTLDWVESQKGKRLSIFPMLYAPVDGSHPPHARNLNPLHWRLIRTCYKFNFRWIPRMYWDNQAGAGVSLVKRCLMQILGQGQMLQWKALFAWHTLRSLNRGSGRCTTESLEPGRE